MEISKILLEDIRYIVFSPKDTEYDYLSKILEFDIPDSKIYLKRKYTKTTQIEDDLTWYFNYVNSYHLLHDDTSKIIEKLYQRNFRKEKFKILLDE